MESIVFNVSYKQFCISYVYWIFLYSMITIVIGYILYPSLPKILFVGVFLFMLIDSILFNRGMRKIVEIAADDNNIVLTYYKLWLKRQICITRKTFGKIQVTRKRGKISLYVYDNRWVRPPCMYVQYSENKFDHLANNICESREDVEKAIALFEKYNYRIEFENK